MPYSNTDRLETKTFSIEKTIIDKGSGDCPFPRTRCQVVIDSVKGSTTSTKLQKLCRCEIGKIVEIEIGCSEGDISRIVDSLLKKMKRKSKIQCKINFFQNSITLPGETVTLELQMIGWQTRTPPLYELSPDVILKYAEEYKGAGARLFQESRFYVASGFYSNAIKYLLIAYTSADTDSLQTAKAKELLSTCHVNLAACLLKYNRYPEVIANCNDALTFKQNMEKALYRRSQGYLGINDYENAEKDIALGMKLYPKNKAFTQLAEKLKEKTSIADAILSSRLKRLFV